MLVKSFNKRFYFFTILSLVCLILAFVLPGDMLFLSGFLFYFFAFFLGQSIVYWIWSGEFKKKANERWLSYK